jgi:hypothetical protein
MQSTAAAETMPEGITPLMTAAINGDQAEISRLLKAGADVNEVANTATALICAAAQGKLVAVGLLLDAGADPKHEDCHGATAASYAAARGHKDVSALLRLHKGAQGAAKPATAAEAEAPPSIPAPVQPAQDTPAVALGRDIPAAKTFRFKPRI